MSDLQPNLEAEIATLVREIVGRTLGNAAASGPSISRPASGQNRRQVLDESVVRQMPAGSTQQIPAGTLVTPLARQAAEERRIRLEQISQSPISQSSIFQSPKLQSPIVAFGADHGGYALKEQLKAAIAGNYQVVDCGTHSTEAVDYPDFAYAVARLVADGHAWRGIIIDGAGIGSCMVANKVPGIRAAMCYDQASAVNSREHNNANVLTLGAGLIGPALARQIVETWLATEFGGGRHARRVDKIDQLDKRYIK
jgi:ribose 5-phosphate isomerase B